MKDNRDMIWKVTISDEGEEAIRTWHSSRKVRMILGAVFVLLIIAGLGYIGYIYFKPTAEERFRQYLRGEQYDKALSIYDGDRMIDILGEHIMELQDKYLQDASDDNRDKVWKAAFAFEKEIRQGNKNLYEDLRHFDKKKVVVKVGYTKENETMAMRDCEMYDGFFDGELVLEEVYMSRLAEYEIDGYCFDDAEGVPEMVELEADEAEEAVKEMKVDVLIADNPQISDENKNLAAKKFWVVCKIIRDLEKDYD